MGREGETPCPNFLAHWHSKKLVQVVQHRGRGGEGVEVIWTESKRTATFFGRPSLRLMLPCRDISITSSLPSLEQLMFYSVAWILSDCIEYVSSDELKIIPIGKPLNISLLKSILTKERWNLYRKPLWNLNELLANLRQGELIVEGRANLSCLVKREP